METEAEHGSTPDPTRGPTHLVAVNGQADPEPNPAHGPVTGSTHAVTTGELAAELSTTPANLRKWCRRRDLLPAPAAPGLPLVFNDGQAEAVREAWTAARVDPPPAATRPRTRPGPTNGSTQSTPRADPRPDTGSGWREALAAERGRTAAAVAEADHLRSELERERVARQAAARHAEEAERGRHVAELRVSDLRAAWSTWFMLLTRRSLWRLRRLPPPPPELTAGPALPPPDGEARWRR